MDRDKIFLENAKPTSIGGQAVIEGIMMKGPNDLAIAVRKPDNEIVIKKEALKGISRSSAAKLPVVRGVIALIDSMILGVRCLTYSAEFFEEEEPLKKSKFEQWFENKLGDKANDVAIYFSVFIAIAMAMLIFIILPTVVTSFLKAKINSHILLNGVEGLFRILLFIGYVLLISRMKDIQRVFEYHGAEHKTIHCFESGKPLTVENARQFTSLHPRCGTSFLLIVMVISIILFSLVGWPNPIVRILSRFALMPIVAGLSYEIIRWAGRSKSKLVCMISYPGLMLQKLTTREPDDSQLEVAIAAMNSVLTNDEEMDPE